MANPAPSFSIEDAAGVDVEQRLSQRAAVAVALAPVLLLLALTLVIGDVIDAATGIAAVVASVAWLVHALHGYQRALGRIDDFPATATDMLADGG